MRVIILAALVGVAGCATQRAWQKPGGSQQDFAQARYECLQRAQTLPVYNPTMGSVDTTDSNLFSACMGAHGWIWQ